MTEPLTDRRRRLLRADIGRTAIALFAERGFDTVTVGDISAAAGISERTFFRYFASKDEVLLDYERHVWERLIHALASRPADEGPVTALRQAFLATSHVEPADRLRVVQLGRILAQAPELNARSRGQRLVNDDELVALVAGRFPKGHKESTMHARIVVTAMNAVAAAEFGAWVQGGGRGDPAERIRAALSLLEQGIGKFDGGGDNQ
ncbi:TetR family transcriptional regulator [Mycobacterium paraseoulense]|uniref:TetR family transcriptional regulator n=1 Tax=Mycobacterium paraseoulense TaxID=590652 RepID=A0A1X0IFV4_9MYCO|nr:TetR family transcriptional regulator [Mycobacterium paraseoulense]MCV7393846.1 TetR family transcriptional regulator [Mycobacterium paraseoulense]ORB45427.1 TetR family transcriptional regulator [Mycobacterium paraseoulense]BBZ70533.1 TetR family transcriptional regulator [Mycobacterium paraseoulense]